MILVHYWTSGVSFSAIWINPAYIISIEEERAENTNCKITTTNQTYRIRETAKEILNTIDALRREVK